MRLKELGGQFYIMMSHHGVNGAAVETNDAQVKDTIKAVRRSMKKDKMSAEELRSMQSELAKQLTKMLPEIIRHGNAVSSSGDFYDKQTFDNDLILCAVYDHIANGKEIAITNNIGPGSGDKVHE